MKTRNLYRQGNATIAVLIAIIVIALIIGGVYIATKSNNNPEASSSDASQDQMMEDKDAMIKDESDTMMEDDAVILTTEDGNALLTEDGDMMIVESADDQSSMKDEDTMMDDESSMKDDDQMMQEKGTYEAYAPQKIALASSSDVVLFFHAGWCPTCKALETNINAHLSDIPNGVHILKVNYDTESELKKKYGITYQHTFVQVDAQGNQIKKWSGSPTLNSLLSEIE